MGGSTVGTGSNVDVVATNAALDAGARVVEAGIEKAKQKFGNIARETVAKVNEFLGIENPSAESIVEVAKLVGKLAGTIFLVFTIATQPMVFVGGIVAGWITKGLVEELHQKISVIWAKKTPEFQMVAKAVMGIVGVATFAFGIWPLLTIGNIARALPFGSGFGLGSAYKDTITSFYYDPKKAPVAK